ncbi:conserved exported hypothetical protein [Sphingomonas sp. T1]|jgi:hypothetical protein|nr:conserved exported hypothetical protein [Sphingomonas sp. T1]
MRIVTCFMLVVLASAIAACTFPFSQKPVVSTPVYDHVPCRTPGARLEEPVDLGEASQGSDPLDAQSGSASPKTPNCVVERGPRYR